MPMYLTDLVVVLVNAAKALRYGLVFECVDPFKKAEIEKKMKEFGLHWIPGYIEADSKYIYIITGGKKSKVKEYTEWFIKVHECSSSVLRSYFRRKVLCLCWEA